MGLTVTAGDLTTAVRNRSDHVGSAFRSDATIRGYLTASCRSLASKLTSERESLYYAQSATVSTVAGTATSAIPTNMWKLIMMRVTIGNRRNRIPEAPLNIIDTESTSRGGWTSEYWPRFRLIGRVLYWAPIPRAVHVVTAFYNPTDIFIDGADGTTRITSFADALDTFDGIDGWDQWAALDSAIKVLNDEKKDVKQLLLEQAVRWGEISDAAGDISGEPTRQVDNWRDDPQSEGRIIDW